MSETNSSLKSLIEKSQDYVENKIEVTKLKTIDKSSEILSSMTVMGSVMILGLLLLFFVSTGLAIYLGYILGRMYYGFFIVGGFYGIICLILYIRREEWIKGPMSDLIVRKLIN